MSTSLKISFAGIVAASMLFAGFAMPAKAQTVAELQALINQLMAQIAAMQGGSQPTGTAACTYTHSATLRVGSRGAQVSMLQNALNASGFSVGSADGVFGNMTANGVRQLQAAKGLTADGVVGPMTGSALANHCAAAVTTPTTPTTPSTVTPGSLQGGAGDATITSTNVDVEREVKEGSTERVLGFRVEAVDSDVQLTNLRVMIENTGSGNRRPDRYLSEISVWMGNTKVGSIDPADMTRSGNEYSRNIQLNNAVVRRGLANRATFHIGFTALNNIDSIDMNNAEWDIDVRNIRFVDGAGSIMTSGENFQNQNGPIQFIDVAGSGDVRLRASLGSNNPAEGTRQVNEFSTTNNVEIFEFRLKAEGADMELESLDVRFISTNETLRDLIVDARLMRGSSMIADVSGADMDDDNDDIISFELYDTLRIEQDETVTFRVVVRLTQADDWNGNSATLRASLNTDNACSGIDVEVRSTGNQVGSCVGSASGFTQTFFVNGANVTFVSSTSTASNNDNTARDFVLVFDLEAVGEDVIVERVQFNNSGNATEDARDIDFTIVGAGTNTPSAALSSNASLNGTEYTVFAGQTRRFTLTVNVTTDTTGQKRISLTNVAGNVPATIIESVSATVVGL